jgi:hypothetical protein
MMRMRVESAGIIGPGLPGWSASCEVLAGRVAARHEALVLPRLDLLPPVERRRTGMQVKLAFAAAQDALSQGTHAASTLATIFAASGADGDVVNEICTMLAGTDRQISPTRFHNSVHNAAAGYWGIATGSREPSTSLCAYDWSFAAGLVEAASQIANGRDRLLLVAGDMPYPQPLLAARPVTLPFGAALLLCRADTGTGGVEIELATGRSADLPTRMDDPLLEFLREDNPAARALPLLSALARRQAASVRLEYTGGSTLALKIEPC